MRNSSRNVAPTHILTVAVAIAQTNKNIIIVYKNVPNDEQEATSRFSTIGFTENPIVSTQTICRRADANL
jgi:hypothetical protein